MIKRQTHLLQFVAALTLPLVAIGVGLQSCSDDGPGIPYTDVAENESQVKNLLMRSPEEAIDIAQRAWEDFYGDESSTASRSGRRCVIDYGRPVEVVRGAKSRGGSGSDTLLYVVNFVDDGGFAVIAAPRHAEELLAVTSQGHYYPESQPDQEIVPGFEMWMENARAYVSIPRDSNFVTIDTTRPKVDTTNIIVGPFQPIDPPGGGTIVRDTTKIPDPDDPGRLQQKEWNDTTFKSVVLPQVRNSWGQGCLGVNDLEIHPEGYLFSNGLCGCGPLAIAEACLFYGEPNQVFIYGGYKQLDWEKMRLHKKWENNKEDGEGYDLCPGDEHEPTHSMIAWLCKAIGDKGGVDVKEDGTGITKSSCLSTLKYFLPNHEISNRWISYYNTNILPAKNHLMLVRADRKDKNGGHVWICDGGKWIEYDHYFATRENSGQAWTVQTKTHAVIKYSHFNWGWHGSNNGWYNQSVITLNDGGDSKTYHNLQYVYIK